MYEASSSRLTMFVVNADVTLRSTQSAHENRIYSVNIHCGDSYPDSPPTIQFVSKVNLPCVDQRNGKVQRYAGSGLHTTDLSKVDPSKVPCLANWKRDYNMETILIELRRYRPHPSFNYPLTETSLGIWLCHNTRSCNSLRKERPFSHEISMWTVFGDLQYKPFCQWCYSQRCYSQRLSNVFINLHSNRSSILICTRQESIALWGNSAGEPFPL